MRGRYDAKVQEVEKLEADYMGFHRKKRCMSPRSVCTQDLKEVMAWQGLTGGGVTWQGLFGGMGPAVQPEHHAAAQGHHTGRTHHTRQRVTQDTLTNRRRSVHACYYKDIHTRLPLTAARLCCLCRPSWT